MPQDEIIIDEAAVVVETPQSEYKVTESVDRSEQPAEEIVKVSEVTEETPKSEETPKAEEVAEVVPDVVKDEYEAVELDEDLALQYLAESRGMTVEEFQDSLTPKEQKKLAPEIEKFQEFVEKTGNHSYKDFEATQKDWTAESQEVVLKELLKKENPTLDKEDIDFLYEDKYVFDEDIDSDRDIKSKQIKAKVDLQKAHSYLDKQKEEYMVNRGSEDYIPEEYRNAKAELESSQKQQEEYSLAMAKNREDYVSKTNDIFTKDFEGFKLKVGDEKTGFEEISIKPENIQETKNTQLDINNFNRQFFDEKTGNLKDPKGFHKALYFGANADKVAEHFYNLGKASQVEKDDKLSKNITQDTIKSINTPTSTWTVKESKD